MSGKWYYPREPQVDEATEFEVVVLFSMLGLVITAMFGL